MWSGKKFRFVQIRSHVGVIFRRLSALFRGKLIIVGGGWGVVLVINRFNEKITLIFFKFNCEYKFEQAWMYQILILSYEWTIYGSCTWQVTDINFLPFTTIYEIKTYMFFHELVGFQAKNIDIQYLQIIYSLHGKVTLGAWLGWGEGEGESL